MSDTAEEILSLTSRKSRIAIKEIQDRLCLTRETATALMDFLIEFGLAEHDEISDYIRLSEPCRRFVELFTNEGHGNTGRLALVCM